ncbi:MAG: hypothetical protein WAP42_07530 [Schleiferiaceae bacterium]
MPWYRKILAHLIFVPNITLGTTTPFLGRPEIFPWTSAYALRKDLRPSLAYIIFAAYLVLSFGYYVATGGIFMIGFRSLMALINASIVFFTVLTVGDDELKYLNRAFWLMFGLNVAVSLMQYFDIFPSFLVRPMNFFIDRWVPTSWDYGRVCSGLYAEPSYHAFGVHHYFAYAILLLNVDQKSPKGLILTAAMAIYDIVIVRSLTGLIIMTIYVVSHQNWRKAWKPVLAIAVAFILALGWYGKTNDLPRSLEFVYHVFYSERYKDLFDYVMWEGGIRTVSLMGSYPFGIMHPFGWGLGSWPQASITSLLDLGISEIEVAFFEMYYSPYDGFRPTAFSADLFLETGVVGFILFAVAIWPYISPKGMWQNPNTRAVVVLFIFNMVILGTIGDPLPFLFLALA